MKKFGILAAILLIIVGLIFIPKIIKNEGDQDVKFKTIETSEAPTKIQELIPRYLGEERALACKVNNEIYVIVTRGEKRTAGYSVKLEKITKVDSNKNFELVAYAKYKDPKHDEMVAQIITYPVVVVKTELEKLPDKIKLEVEYED
ncbi:hypothetical protein CLPU_4c02150 [Gottschalkia purinilytica]|uniref:PrcB C-terminal domain-containing protein n=1 Tax=Gottschalkia purinilytica TaxID=1503 RepID=A0A0L0WCG1_GOTPU|nr:protease complex subunit PrcB family protein [Gottschalkia purinilytica]KNF09169.1 hypothetical protein CLPU_4c02150 [Gottschalkia purinilytica]